LFNGVVVKKLNVAQNIYWYDMDDGWLYLDYDGTGDIDNGLLGLLDSVSSTNARFKILQFYSPVYGVQKEFDLSKLNHLEFYIDAYVTPNFSLEFSYQYSGLPAMLTYDYVYENSYIRIKDESYIGDADPSHIEYYTNIGYNNGASDTENYYDTVIIPQVQETYEAIGFQDAYDQYYTSRYQAGYADAQTEGPALISYIPGILGVVMSFFFQIASIEFAGVSILNVIVALFGITVALLIFKIFLGGK
jgi:hypothetical protein